LTSFDLFTSAKWSVVASMARPDSGDSNLPNEPGNEVCDIIYCVAIYYEKGASGNAFLRKEKFRAQVSRKVRTLKALKETVGCVYFLNLGCIWLFRPCRPFYCDVFPVCLVWSGMTFMPSALCCDCYDRSEVVSLTEVVNNKRLCVNRCILFKIPFVWIACRVSVNGYAFLKERKEELIWKYYLYFRFQILRRWTARETCYVKTSLIPRVSLPPDMGLGTDHQTGVGLFLWRLFTQ